MAELKQEVTDLSGSLSAPLKALMISLVSVWLASRWLNYDHATPLIIAGVIIFVAYLCDWLGRACLPDSPRIALVFLELWIFAPLMVGALASAAMVIISVHLSLPEGTTPERKETVGAITTALTTFLTAGFISWIGERDDSRFAERIKRIFYSKYKRPKPDEPRIEGVKYFQPASRGERLVYSNEYEGIEGWGRGARLHRARELSNEVAAGTSDAPP